jgi:hypothetical protein
LGYLAGDRRNGGVHLISLSCPSVRVLCVFCAADLCRLGRKVVNNADLVCLYFLPRVLGGDEDGL